jgi:hypothetical protein
MTAFMITIDLIDTGAANISGPSGITDKDKARLEAGEGIEFKLADDDGEVYYIGRRLEESSADHWYQAETELAPLDCFGGPSAGCTMQLERNAEGKWEAIN